MPGSVARRRFLVNALVTSRLAWAAWIAAFVAVWLVNAEAQGTWATETAVPSTIQDDSVTALNGLVYLVGGDLNQVFSNSTQAFDPATHAWTTLAPYPGPGREHASLVPLNGSLYLIGGLTAWPQPSVSTVQRYDPSTNTWTAVAPLPVARGTAGAAVINGKIYVAGGLENGASVSDFTVYDPSTNAWTTLPSMPTARSRLRAAAVNGKFYAIGGVTATQCGVATVEVYDPSTNAWTTGTPMTYARATMAIGLVNGHIQVFGGDGNSVNCGVTGAAEDFDPVANTWTRLPDMVTPRTGTDGATINGSVYIPAGALTSGDAGSTVHERFDYAAQTLPTGWADQDIGTVGLPGGASALNGVFSVEGEGSDIWGTADSFNFASEGLSGDGQIVARVVSEKNTNTFAKAGVMIRGALTAGAQDVILDVKPGGGIEFMSRATSGGSTTFIAGGTGGAPVWLRLARTGTTITGSSSPDGVNWTTIGSVGVAFPTSVSVGLAVCSHSSGVINTSTFDNVTVTAGAGGGGTDAPPVVSITSPTSGASFTAPATITVTASASDTDATPVSKVDFFANNGTTNTPIGTATASPYTITWSNVAVGSYSLTAVATDTANLATTSAPVSVSVSASGGGGGGLPAPWVDQDVGTVGLAGSASFNSSTSTFTVQGAGADIWGTADSFNFLDQQLSGDGQIVARVASATNTNAFAKAGIMIRGDLTAGAATVLLDVKPGGGLEFMARATAGGSMSFIAGPAATIPVWVKLTRSGNTFAAFSSPDGATWTSVGSTTLTMTSAALVGLAVCSHTTSQLMTAAFDNVTVGTAATTDLPPAVAITSPSAGASFTAPATIAITANATDTDSTPVAKVDFFANNGTTNSLVGTVTSSPYTFTWTNVAAGSYTLTAVATDTANQATTSAGVPVSVTSGGGTGALPSPWADQDVGSVGLAGSATFNAGTFTVKGAGADIWGTADSFNFVNQPFGGDGQIVARVVSLQNTNTFAKAGVTFRETLNANATNVTFDVKPGGGLELLVRSSTGASTAFVAGPAGSAPIWLKLVRSGSTFSAFASPDGATWTSVGSTTVTMSSSASVGLVVCSHTTSQLNTATFDNVAAGTVAGGTDLPPAVSITSPTSGSAFTAPATITVTATASDTDSTPVSKVDFFANNGTTNTAIGTATASPYTITWSNVAAGTYSVTAVATDTANQATTSAPVSVTVSASGGGGGGALPTPWVDTDVGAVGLAGSASFTSSTSTFTVQGAGSDVWGTADSFNFVYQTLGGDGQITARVTAMQNTNVNAKAGVMIRQSLSPGDASVTLDLDPHGLSSAGGGIEMLVRSSNGASTTFAQGEVAVAPIWLKLVRAGSTISGYISTDGNGWSLVASATLTTAAPVYVGLVVCSHDTTKLNTSTFDNVSVATTSTVTNPLTFTAKVLAAPAASGTAVGVPNLVGPTSLALGPDGRLYTSVVDGRLFVLTLDQTTLMQPGQVSVTNVQEIDDIYNHPSLTCNPYPTNCTPSTTPGRQVTGVLIDPSSTASNIILYVSNSGLGTQTTDTTLDQRSGTITRLVLQPGTGNNLVVTSDQDLVVGLPRSPNTHATNGMVVGPDGWMYIAQGGITNAGQPSTTFGNAKEQYLGAAVLRLNLSALGTAALPLDMHNVNTAADMTSFAGVFELYATGYRNPYDLLWHSNGRLYINVNSPNLGEGLTPSAADGCSSTPSIDVGTWPDYFRLVVKGDYGGHPNPARGECVWGDGTPYSPPLTPLANYRAPIGNYVRGWGDSTDGMIEYTSNAFGGAMQHNIVSTSYDTDMHVRRLVLTPDGSAVNAIIELNPSAFTDPLDVWTDHFGNLFIADYGANQIVLLIPSSPGQ